MKLQAGPDDRGLRLDVFLSGRLNSLTRSQIQMLNRNGAIQVQGRRQKAGYKLRGGEIIEVDLGFSQPTTLVPQQIPLQIHYEDEDLAVIEKPAGLVVHPGAKTTEQTMVHALLFHFRNLSDAGGKSRPGIVHRLDKRTSGLMVVAKNNTAHARLSKSFQDRQIQKTYLALVHGRPRREEGVIELSIGRHRTIRTRMAAQTARGRAALTEYRIIEKLRGFSLLEVNIKSGRTHQIRVHLSAIGTPVVGDDVYGERRYREFVRKYGPLDRYFLHAASLRFSHPSTGVLMQFHSGPPKELLNLLQRIKS